MIEPLVWTSSHIIYTALNVPDKKIICDIDADNVMS